MYECWLCTDVTEMEYRPGPALAPFRRVYRLRQDLGCRTLRARCQGLRKSGISETRAHAVAADDERRTAGENCANGWFMFDVIIAGCGPTGAMLAAELRLHDVRVLLL